MYPIALLWKDDGSIDGNLYAKQYPASITNAVDYTTQKEDYAFYNLDNSKLASKYANFITWLSKSINKNDQPTNINLTNLRIFQNLLNIWNANDWTNQSTTSDKIFQSI
jgi:hypothetical protein